MRRLRLLGVIMLVASASCGPESDEAGKRSDSLESRSVAGETAARGAAPARDEDPTPGTMAEAGAEGSSALGAVRGVVRDARTDRPLEEALVSAGEFGTSTDAAGSYVMPLITPGPVKVRAYRRGFRAESTTVAVDAGRATVVDLPLQPADPPCCELAGDWTARFVLDSAGLNSRPATRTLSGSLSLAPDEGDGRVATAAGTSSLDFGPILGTDIRGGVGEVEGTVFHGDSAALTLLPRFGDWAIELRGRQSADTVRGDWFQRASCCGAYGTFLMVRGPSADEEAPSSD